MAQQPSSPSNAPLLFDKGMNALSSAGSSRSDVEAAKNIRASAEQGYVPAQIVLGYMLDTGLALTREPDEAAIWYKKAAEQGDRLAQWSLGRLHLTGVAGQRDLQEAEKWLTKAAAQDDPFGQYLLGLVKEERDYTRAPEWFRKAAEQGLPQAQQKLGSLLKQGRGVKQDKVEAYVWLLLSFEAGNPAAAIDLSQLESDLGSTSVEQLKKKARTLQESYSRNIVARGCTGWPGEFEQIPVPPPPKLEKFCH